MHPAATSQRNLMSLLRIGEELVKYVNFKFILIKFINYQRNLKNHEFKAVVKIAVDISSFLKSCWGTK